MPDQHTTVIRTRLFPTYPEGDPDLCNSQPGSALTTWLRSRLAEVGVPATEPQQEDYGWGVRIDGDPAFWIAVSFSGSSEGTGIWVISLDVMLPLLTWPWTRQRLTEAARPEAARLWGMLEAALSAEPAITIESMNG